MHKGGRGKTESLHSIQHMAYSVVSKVKLAIYLDNVVKNRFLWRGRRRRTEYQDNGPGELACVSRYPKVGWYSLVKEGKVARYVKEEDEEEEKEIAFSYLPRVLSKDQS